MTKLQEIRQKCGIRQSELAQRLNITRQCVCIAEKKGIRNVEAAKRYAAKLDCNPLDLIEL